MAERRPLVLINGRYQELPSGDTLPGGGGLTETQLKETVRSFTAQQGFAQQTLTYGSTIAWALDSEQVAKVTLTGDATLQNPTGAIAGHTYLLLVIQDGSGNHNLSYGSAYEKTTDVDTTANSRTLLSFYYDGTKMVGGANFSVPKNSLEIDAQELQLVGDEASPGNSKVYGTDGAGNKGWNDGLTEYFESAEQTIANGGKTTVAHGLSGNPKLFTLSLRCKTAEHNYSVGDELLFGAADIDSTSGGGGATRSISIAADGTNLISTVGANFNTGSNAYNKNTGGLVTLTNSRWRIVMRAWR